MSEDCVADFRSVVCDKSRELTEADMDKMSKQGTVSDFKQKKLELEAQKNWDKFYKRNGDKFFKDRNWSKQDLQDLCTDIDLNRPCVFMEAGCGVGNMMFPLSAAFPNLRLQGFDFSKNAVQLLQDRAAELNLCVATDIVDLAIACGETTFEEAADIATLIFVLSAIHPEKHRTAVSNMVKYVKVGGSVIIRDYAMNDYAMVRFGRDSKLADRFYVRQDGTRAYYFDLEELKGLFESEGFEYRRGGYLHRQTVNHQKSLSVPRVFVQAIFIRVR